MKKALKWLDENLEESLLLMLLAVISVSMMGQIVLRYIFKTPLPWVEELCRYCFVYSGAISAGYCVKKHLGIRLDILTNVFPMALQAICEIISKLLVIGLYLYLSYSSIGLMSTATTISPALQIPIQYVYAGLPIGFMLGAFRGIQMLVIYILELTKKKEVTQ